MQATGRAFLLLGAALFVAGAPRLARAQGETDATKYVLTMDNLRKLTAVTQNMKASSTEVELDDDDTLAQSVAKIQANKAAMAALQKVKLMPSDYVLTLTTYLATAMVVAFQKQDAKFAIPEGVSVKNVEFIRAHWTELDQMSKQAGLTHP